MPHRVSATRPSTALATALLFVLIFGAGSASAHLRALKLKTGTTFNSGSGVALGTDAGLYASGTTFPVEFTPLPLGESSLTFGSFSIPAITPARRFRVVHRRCFWCEPPSNPLRNR